MSKRPSSALGTISPSAANHAMAGLSITPPRAAAAGKQASRAALTPTGALEAALRAADAGALGQRVVLYMGGSFCPLHVQHLQAVEAAAEHVARSSGGAARVVGAFLAPSHDDRVSEEYAAAGISRWFLPSECRIRLAELAVGGNVAVDGWAARQPEHVPAAAAQADLQAFLDGWCADLRLSRVRVVRLLGSDDTEPAGTQPLLCLEREGMPRGFMLAEGQSAAPAPSGGRLSSAEVRAAFHSQSGAEGMLHAEVEAQLHEWWRAPRVLAFPLPPSFRAELAARFESPLSDLADLQSRLELDRPICRALQSSLHFCSGTYPKIVSEAAKLCALTEPIPLQSAGTDGTLNLPRHVARALLAAMLLGMPPPCPGSGRAARQVPRSEGADTEDMLNPRACRHLWTAETPGDVRALLAALAYFDSNSRTIAVANATGNADVVSLRRCVLAKEVDFAARSPRPMQPVSLLQASADEARQPPPALIATCRVGRFACGDSRVAMAVDSHVDVALRPELLVGALLCPALRRDEAMIANGTVHVLLDDADGQCEPTCHTGSLSVPAQTLVLIDFGGAPPIRAAAASCASSTGVAVAESWLARVRRDLEKCYCAFAAGAQVAGANHIRSALGAPPDADDARPTGPAAVDAREVMVVELVMQWLAASEAGCALELQCPRTPSLSMADHVELTKQFSDLVRQMAEVPAAASPTVGWVWARLQEYVKERLDVVCSSADDGCSFFAALRSAVVDGAAFPAGTAPSDLAAVLALEKEDAEAIAAGIPAVADDQEAGAQGDEKRSRVCTRGIRGGGRSLAGRARSLLSSDASDESEMAVDMPSSGKGIRAGGGGLFGDSDDDDDDDDSTGRMEIAASGGGGSGEHTGWTSSDDEDQGGGAGPARRLF